MEQFAFIIALLLIGVLLQRASAPADFAKSLNFFVIYVSMPATVLVQIPKIHLDISALALVITPWILLPIMVYLVWIMTRNTPTEVRAALLLLIPLGNTSFVGIPIIHTLLGEKAIGYVLMYDQFGTFLMLSLYGSAVIARYESGKVHMRLIMKKLFLFPPFLILIFAILFGESPKAVEPYLQTLSATLVPLALVSVGYSLRFRENFEWPMLLKAMGLKLILMPSFALLFLLPFDVDPMVLKTAVLESGMPAMITAGALAIASGFAPALSAAIVGYGIFFALFTVPLWEYGITLILGL